LIPENGSWITVVSDVIDSAMDDLLQCAKEISQAFQTETIAISCMDSDYLLMNLFDAPNEIDAWASCGRYPDGKAPRRSNFAAWEPYVSDVSAFRHAMKAKYLFAEDCLKAIEPLLTLPVSQSMYCGDDIEHASVVHFYCKSESREEESRPPAFRCSMPPLFFVTGQQNVVTFNNQGGASRGVAVCLAGPCISERQIDVASIYLQFHDNRGEWNFLPVDVKETVFQNGVKGMYGECRDIRIPFAVPENLPWKKKMDMEFQRGISVRFTLTVAAQYVGSGESINDLHVILIPLKNFSGQSGAVLKHQLMPAT
jgi:hypothetical protein